MATLNIEECELLGDSKYRAYIAQVEKALRSFENTSEWPDLISALDKLNKVGKVYNKEAYMLVPMALLRIFQCARLW